MCKLWNKYKWHSMVLISRTNYPQNPIHNALYTLIKINTLTLYCTVTYLYSVLVPPPYPATDHDNNFYNSPTLYRRSLPLLLQIFDHAEWSTYPFPTTPYHTVKHGQALSIAGWSVAFVNEAVYAEHDIGYSDNLAPPVRIMRETEHSCSYYAI